MTFDENARNSIYGSGSDLRTSEGATSAGQANADAPGSTRAGGSEDTREVEDSSASYEQSKDVTRAGGGEDTRSQSTEQALRPGAPAPESKTTEEVVMRGGGVDPRADDNPVR